MRDTYTELYIHLIFAVKNNGSRITANIKDDLYKYMTGIIKHQNQKLFIINGMQDHVHLLLNFTPNCVLSSLVHEIKEHSSKYISNQPDFHGEFSWQEGFGGFSVSKREVPSTMKYIRDQETIHSNKTFKEEYIEILKENGVEYEEKDLFDFDLTD